MGYFACDLPIMVATSQMCCHDIVDDCVWNRELLSPEDWLVPLPDACLAELDAIVEWAHDLSAPMSLAPVANGSSAVLKFPACTKVMSYVQTKLKYQAGIAVIDRVPVERYSIEGNRAIYWVLASMLGQLVCPAPEDVRLTSLLHTDGARLHQAPEFVGLFCLEQYPQGGSSQFVSLMTIHNEMRLHHPDLLPRLYHPFWWECQKEAGVDAPGYAAHAIYRSDGRHVVSRYDIEGIRNGYSLSGDELDETGEAALEALHTLVENPVNRVELCLEPGQLQYVNNHRLAHAGMPLAATYGQRFWQGDAGMGTLDG